MQARIEFITTQLKNLELNQWAHVAAIASSSTAATVSVFEIASRLLAKSNSEESLVRRIVNERESAVHSYKQANQALNMGALGAALAHINHALAEFTETALAGSHREVWADKQLQAEMLFFKAVIQLQMKKPNAAMKTLKKVIDIDDNHLLAHNVLANSYIHHQKDHAAAETHLKKSRGLASKQIFANYYLAKMKDDQEKMHKVMNELTQVFAQLPASLEERNASQAWLSLQGTTLPSMVLELLIDWLRVALESVDDANTLANIANIGSLLSQQPAEVVSAFAEPFLEVRLAALNKLATLKSYTAAFDTVDHQWREAYGLVETIESGESNYFIEFPAKQITKFVAAKFDSFDGGVLVSDVNNHQRMSHIIAEWAMHGWMKHQDVQAAVKAMKHLKGPAREKGYDALQALCATPAIIKYFVDEYIAPQAFHQPEQWSNIFKATVRDNKLYSVFHLMCECAEIQLHVYTAEDNALSYQAPYSAVADDVLGTQRINPKTKAPEALHLSYHPEDNTLRILKPLETPSDVYRAIALQDAWSLHTKNPNNFAAYTHLSRKGAIFVKTPSGASIELSDEVEDKPTKVLNVSRVSSEGFFSRSAKEVIAEFAISTLVIAGLSLLKK